jgi:hypothetical protein
MLRVKFIVNSYIKYVIFHQSDSGFAASLFSYPGLKDGTKSSESALEQRNGLEHIPQA